MSTLSQCLSHLPIKSVKAIAAAVGLGRASNRDEIIEMFLNEKFLAGFMNSLDDQDLRLIALFTWWVKSGGVPKKAIETLLTGAKVDKPLERLASLGTRGIVFQTSYGWGDYGNFFMPEDLADKFSLLLARKFLPPAAPPSENIAENMFSGNFFDDCLTFMAYAYKNKLEITQKGTIHRRTVGKILKLMQFKEGLTETPEDWYYPFRFWLLFRYCLSTNAVSLKDRVLTVQTVEVEKWLKQKRLTMLPQAIAFIWQMSFQTCPNPLVKASLTLIAEMTENQWYAYAALAEAIRKMTGLFNCKGPGPERFLDLALDTGLLVEGLSREGERLVRFGFWSPRNMIRELPEFPGEEDGFWVQPNFEILTPPHLKPDLRWQLEMLANPVKADRAIAYALTKEGTLGFFDRGGSAPDMLDFLAKHSKNPLPQNVVFTIKEWWALYGRISFWDVFLLRCDDIQLAEEIAANPKLKPYIKGRFDQNHLIIARSQYDSLLATLQKAGYFPRKGIIEGGGKD